jgi:hypothetical protein
VQYGPRIAAIIVYLYIGQFLSKQRTARALAELFGIPLSSGTVAGITARAAGRLGGFLERVRDTIAAAEAVTDAAPDGQWCWAAQAAEAITAMQTLVREAISQGRDPADPAALAAQVRLFRSAALAGASQTAARSGALMKKHNALARRLRDRQDDYLRFTRDWRIPPDNNERDIRMTKLKQKVSGCLRTLTGARQFGAIRSYLSTAAKHDLGFFNALVMLTEGQPWAAPKVSWTPDSLGKGIFYIQRELNDRFTTVMT